MIFEPFTIKNVTFKNRILRSSVGGRTANYDGTVTDVWKNFEKRFADGGVGGIISTTLNINKYRESPMEYPPIAEDKYVKPLKKYIKQIKATGCKYIIQIGDPGYATQTSLFPQIQDSRSSSTGFDLIYGYNNKRTMITEEEIQDEIRYFADAAARVRETGADGLEITAAKGYIIHQFLNPGLNRRKDDWGGSVDKRFRLLEEIVKSARQKIGSDFLFGIRLSAVDYNYLPLNLRFPIVLPLKSYFMGNNLKETLYYGKKLKELGVDYLHIVSGFGFISPKVTPGVFPLEAAKIFFNSTRHLSFKAACRATLLNILPRFIAKMLFNIGWKYKQGINLEYARKFREEVALPIIANGGFQQKDFIENALKENKCDLVSMARELIANPNLVREFEAGKNEPDVPCTLCNRCAGRTATSPLGCYEPARFSSIEEMQEQIMAWNKPDI
jgi:2,4-dienoyl-CoA reductase (NADPH2)